MGQTNTITATSALTGTRVNAADLTTANVTLSGLSATKAFTHGTGSGQVDLVYIDQITIEASSTESLDLTDLVDQVFGTALSFAAVKYIRIHSANASNKQLTVGGNANPFGSWLGSTDDEVKVNAGGWLEWCDPADGFAVTPDTGDILDIANASGGSSVVNVIILGTSS